LEQTISNIWQDLLDIPNVGLDDNFFDLGGNSLLVLQVHNQIRELDIRELSITDLFRFPTVRSLAEYLCSDSNGEEQSSTKKRTDRAYSRREALKQQKQRRRKS